MARRKRKTEESPLRTVVVLGAGASAADGAPTQGALFFEYFKHAAEEPMHKGQHKWDSDLRNFFDQFFGLDALQSDLSAFKYPTFEEVLGILEIADSQRESFRDWGTSHLEDSRQKPRIQHVHELLILLIAEVLDRTLEGERTHHRILLDGLERLGWLPRTTFISLNYDILIDNALLDLHPAWDLDYHVTFANVDMQPDFHNDRWHLPRADKALLLLKLHGSLNWLYCPTCRTLDLTPKRKQVCQLKWHPDQCLCRKCKTLAVPIVIPPTYFKALSNFHLRQIWDRADKELSHANRIIFCGYSFPDADVHVKYLLKRAEMNRTGVLPEVYVVNGCHPLKTCESCRQEHDRYTRFLKGRRNLHWTGLSFEQFAEDPERIED